MPLGVSPLDGHSELDILGLAAVYWFGEGCPDDDLDKDLAVLSVARISAVALTEDVTFQETEP